MYTISFISSKIIIPKLPTHDKNEKEKNNFKRLNIIIIK